jgi:hypothetical protein
MDRFDDDTLFAELRELRSQPRPEFTAELDRRAAAGFPRGADTTASVFAPLVDWWRGMSPPRRLVPIVGAAMAVVLVATATVAITQSGRKSVNLSMRTSSTAEEAVAPMAESESAESAGASNGAAPQVEEAEGGSVEAAPAEEAGGAARSEEAEAAGEAEGTIEAAPPVHGENQGAGDSSQRDIERSAYIVLGTQPDEVSAASAKVYEAVHAANGVVLHSSVQSGSKGATGASFDLLIPSAKLNDTLATFSSIAEVRQRHDATNDITAPTVSAAEELADSNATIDSLLKQLGDAETEAERESVEARLREERRRHATIRASLDHLHQRASMSEVTLRIVTDHGAGVTPPSQDNGGWDVGDALHDAGHVLTIAAGVLLIGLAVLAPFALIGLLIWVGNRIRVRRLRERTLG